ncbi:tetratricopeptide repeat protein [candidate division WOR-3 bacterium]|nr:tetratricopeptide repeat protein [candidate division WOR-3 bacterium]MCK4527191.1 tetratricopeptide repeat protein [candidate division WOR-3 bacterium]
MICKNCGEEVRDDFVFCPYCGFPIKEDSPAYWMRQVTEFRRKGKMRDALKNCRKVCEELNDPYIYRLAGYLAYIIGEIELAIENQKKSLKLLPDFPDTLYEIGISFFRMGKIKKAIDYFEKCIGKNPDFSMAYYWLGHCYYHTGDIDEAIDNLLKLIKHSPQSKIAHYHLGIAYHSKGNEEKALEHFKILEEAGVEYASLYFWMGNGYFLLHEITAAIKYLKKALELNPEEDRSKRLLSRITEVPQV